MTNKLATPKLEHIEQICSGWVNKYVLTYRLADGSTYEYEAASRRGLNEYEAALKANGAGKHTKPDAVCIVPLLPNDTILLIREFRYPLNAWCISFPAGLMEPDETIAQCAQRELLEEVGCRLNDKLGDAAITVLPQSGYSSTGLTEENVQVVLARALQDETPQPERGELIESFTLHYSEVADFLAKNSDLIGTRAQLILEMVKRIWDLKSKLPEEPLPQQPLTPQDYA
ncbi:NUDIX hydrolase [Adlercreutzia sp. ZJ304]|uniref:NUDIX hydrolase n=1 Tax=Adlercreutzia sp. ZJ304 TaxID=2709791 RepID=UPI0013EA6E2F|nr:NUDIX hydrolase [Adlercreutzia sp. ZJ304]